VQPIEAPAHVARVQTQVHAYAGRQVDHPRTASNTIRNVAASTWLPIRSRSPGLAGLIAHSGSASPR
jgi:hypothetical protein